MNGDTANILYRLNHWDEIIFVNEGWTSFALSNDGPDLVPDRVLRRPLWNFITDVTTQALYRDILDKVRAGHTLRFTFRCDAPERERLYEMTVSPQAGEVVQFETQLLWSQERPTQNLIARDAPRSLDLLHICGWCLRVDTGGPTWQGIEEAVNSLRLFERSEFPKLLHEMCDDCYAAVSKLVARA
ncbi:MAG TPA: hypothetical protein VM934_16185 [Pyrinomonadaceae bacterium]|jgi:hypothetical protein|nr:hypothetical protein [Pyrinomonadaceae bacterium]